MRYKRKTNCALCDSEYIIDTEERSGVCHCGKVYNIHVADYVLETLFKPLKADANAKPS